MELVTQSLFMYGLTIAIAVVTACVIKGIVMGLGHAEVKRSAKTKTAAAEPKPETPTRFGVPAEHVAAISAAVYAIMGAHRIVHIGSRYRGQVWTAEGRWIHQTSHAPHKPPHALRHPRPR